MFTEEATTSSVSAVNIVNVITPGSATADKVFDFMNYSVSPGFKHLWYLRDITSQSTFSAVNSFVNCSDISVSAIVFFDFEIYKIQWFITA